MERHHCIVAIGNPLFYLIAIGIGVGVLVSENSGTSGTGGVEYITFIAPALLASAAITGALDEAMFPVMEVLSGETLLCNECHTHYWATNCTWCFYRRFSASCLYSDLLLGSAYCIWSMSVEQSWDVIPVTIFAAGAFAAIIMGITAKVKNDDYFMTVLGRLIIMPMFLFSGTFFPLNTMPIYLQPIVGSHRYGMRQNLADILIRILN